MMNHVVQGADGSIQMADVAATPEPRSNTVTTSNTGIRFEPESENDLANEEETARNYGDVRHAPTAIDSTNETVPRDEGEKESSSLHAPPSRYIHTTSTQDLDLGLGLGLSLGIGIDIDLDLVTNRGGVGGGTVAMVTVAPANIETTVITRLLVTAASASIGQR
ncbi:hypothetical protein LA080_013406 [Diaporthe eres]|nr:hypothetical protein LA080_013406 [Diaporthe eres]